MRNNTHDQTLKNNYIQTYQFIQDYQEVKAGKHRLFKRVKDFYQGHRIYPQNFSRNWKNS